MPLIYNFTLYTDSLFPIFTWEFEMVDTAYLKQVSIFAFRAKQFKQAGNSVKAEEMNFAIQGLDYANDPDLADVPHFEAGR